MKKNILSKIALICLLLISVSCSKDNIENTEEITEAKPGFTLSFDSTLNNDLQQSKLSDATYKYLKVVYKSTANKELVRGLYSSATVTNVINEIDTNTDVWVFNEIDQLAVDSIFYNSSPGGLLCLACFHLAQSTEENPNQEYIDVAEVCYFAGTSNASKEGVRNSYPELMHVLTNNNSDCETWYMKKCCLTNEHCPIPGVTSHVLSVTDIQTEG